MGQLIYRHKSHTPADWMPASMDVMQQDGWHVFSPKRAAWGPPQAQGEWHDIGDGWQVATTSESGPPAAPIRRKAFPGSPHEILAVDGSRLPVLPVYDRHGRVWFTPAILSDAGEPLLPRTIRHDGKRLVTSYDERQQSMIDAAQEARRVLVDGHGDLEEEAAAHIAAEAVAWAYHIPPMAVLALGVIDTGMLGRILLTLAGVTQAVDDSGDLIVDYMSEIEGAAT